MGAVHRNPVYRRKPTIEWVEDYIYRHLRHGPLHFTLLDPDKQSPKESADMAHASAEAGSHLIMIGGSTPESAKTLDKMTRLVKKQSGLPIILFPGGHTQISTHADAIWFMSLLNSTDPRFLMQEQVAGSQIIDKMRIEAIPMGYIVVEPGGMVGKVGKANLITRKDVDGAISHALAAQMFGMRFVYLEAGSGADTPVPAEMIKAVRRAIHIPLIVGGGIKTADQAHDVLAAGADIIVTGTLIEGALDVKQSLRDMLFTLSEKLKRKVRRHLDLGELYAQDEPKELKKRYKKVKE